MRNSGRSGRKPFCFYARAAMRSRRAAKARCATSRAAAAELVGASPRSLSLCLRCALCPRPERVHGDALASLSLRHRSARTQGRAMAMGGGMRHADRIASIARSLARGQPASAAVSPQLRHDSTPVRAAGELTHLCVSA